MIKFKYYGHACFLLETDNEKLLFDPFLTGNPVASISADEVECDYILLTHAHGDHYGDATQIAQKTGAKVISTPDSKIKVYVIPTNEELMIAKETLRLVK